MKKTLFWLALVVMALAACSSGSLKEAYTASGDGSAPDDLKKTSSFAHDDDLNVVVTLNSHSRSLPVNAVFYGPDGSSYATEPVEADSTVGEVVLGLDWETKGSTSWASGEWKVEIVIDNKTADTLAFDVAAPPVAPVGQ